MMPFQKAVIGIPSVVLGMHKTHPHPVLNHCRFANALSLFVFADGDDTRARSWWRGDKNKCELKNTSFTPPCKPPTFPMRCHCKPSWQRSTLNQHNSSWFPWIIHLPQENGANQRNQWQRVITVRVVPFLRSHTPVTVPPLSSATLHGPSVPRAAHSQPV